MEECDTDHCGEMAFRSQYQPSGLFAPKQPIGNDSLYLLRTVCEMIGWHVIVSSKHASASRRNKLRQRPSTVVLIIAKVAQIHCLTICTTGPTGSMAISKIACSFIRLSACTSGFESCNMQGGPTPMVAEIRLHLAVKLNAIANVATIPLRCRHQVLIMLCSW
jgi:hypothetical protein